MSAYTDEMTKELVDAYKETPTQETVEAFATKFDLSPVSVRSKLVAEGVYKSAAKAKGEKAETLRKSDIADYVNARLMATLKVSPLASLENLRKDDLEALANALVEGEDSVA